MPSLAIFVGHIAPIQTALVSVQHWSINLTMSNNYNPQQEDTVWPPAPSLLPPKPREPKPPFLARISIWLVVLIDIGGSIFISSFVYLDRSMGHHAIHWVDIAAEGLIPGMAIFVMHLWLRRNLLKRNSE